MKFKTIAVGAVALIAVATMILATTNAAYAWYCYYEWVWTPFGYVYQYVCY